jgi:hypothetical protein
MVGMCQNVFYFAELLSASSNVVVMKWAELGFGSNRELFVELSGVRNSIILFSTIVYLIYVPAINISP